MSNSSTELSTHLYEPVEIKSEVAVFPPDKSLTDRGWASIKLQLGNVCLTVFISNPETRRNLFRALDRACCDLGEIPDATFEEKQPAEGSEQ